ncbi:MAG: hypothetical protein JWL58_1327, partial [Streptosporangiaceae bacterium]|nr:hypothetical protein [Streptosporangiaceae bacterium]
AVCGVLLSRMATDVPIDAISTQLPLSPLRRLFLHGI